MKSPTSSANDSRELQFNGEAAATASNGSGSFPSINPYAIAATESINVGQAEKLNLDLVNFQLSRANNHSLLNKWLVITETRFFALQQKEKKARVGQQCRIIVKGAKYFPLQVSSGSTTEQLWPTWEYCRRLEEAVPKDICGNYKNVETFVKNHIKEFLSGLKEEPDQDDLSDEESEEQDDGEFLPPPAMPLTSGGVASAGAGPGSPAGTSGGVRNLFFTSARPTTREEWDRREELREQARRNRTILIMLFTAVYAFLMRSMSFDAFALLLFVLEGFVFYACNNYRQISMEFAKRNAKTRVNRVKDWFHFGVKKKEGRKQQQNKDDDDGAGAGAGAGGSSSGKQQDSATKNSSSSFVVSTKEQEKP